MFLVLELSLLSLLLFFKFPEGILTDFGFYDGTVEGVMRLKVAPKG